MKIFNNSIPAETKGKFKLSDDAYLIQLKQAGKLDKYLHYKIVGIDSKYYFKNGTNKACVFPRENAIELLKDIKINYPNDYKSDVAMVHATSHSLKRKPFLSLPKRTKRKN